MQEPGLTHNSTLGGHSVLPPSSPTPLEYPSWCRGAIRKHPEDAIAILHNLLDAARAKGQCSTNDITHACPWSKHLHGCVSKTLPSCGLYQTGERISPRKDDKKKHYHKAFVWKVKDGAWPLLETRHAEIHNLSARLVLKERPREGRQYLLAM